MAFLLKEKCFRLPPINGGSDGTYRVAAAITQFAGGSTKYFSNNQSFPSLREIQPENQTVVVRASDWNSEDPSLNPGWFSMSFFPSFNCKKKTPFNMAMPFLVINCCVQIQTCM